jgi:ribosomal protein S6
MATMTKDKEALDIIDEMADENADHAEARIYELAFHLDPELSQDQVKSAYQTVRDQIKKAGEIITEGEPTKIPLAYTMYLKNTSGRRDFDSAYFCWIAYEAAGPAHQDIISSITDQANVIRFIDLRTTKEGAKHSADMHEIFANAALLQQKKDDEAEIELSEDAPETLESDEVVAAEVSPVAAEVAA